MDIGNAPPFLIIFLTLTSLPTCGDALEHTFINSVCKYHLYVVRSQDSSQWHYIPGRTTLKCAFQLLTLAKKVGCCSKLCYLDQPTSLSRALPRPSHLCRPAAQVVREETQDAEAPCAQRRTHDVKCPFTSLTQEHTYLV